MSLASITLITALRAVLVAFVSVGIAARCVPRLRVSISNSAIWLLLLALLMPPMVVGYHVATTRAAALGWTAELMYTALVIVRIAPLAMVLVWLWPRGTSGSGHFTFATMNSVSLSARCVLKIREWVGDLASIFCIVFVVAFQEFDLAACMNARSWTIALFDAQAGGLAIGESLRLMLWPLAVQCSALVALLAGNRNRAARETRELPDEPASRSFAPTVVFLAILSLPFAGPLFVISKGFAGLSTLQNFALTREVANSFLLALTASIAAWMIAGWALQSRGRTVLFALPGLFGGLVVSLGLLALFQISPLYLLRSTPIPVVIALILGLAPSALFVRHILASSDRAETVHSARLMGNRSVLWLLAKRPALWGGALLFLQAYGDFTANSLLAPPSLTSAFSRIFNLMHYGQTSVLSAMLLVTLAAPLVALLLIAAAARIHATRREN
jgi:iron(III) transport system permease protein